MTGAEIVSKIAPQNNEESAVCLLKIELTFGYAGYKVILKTRGLRWRNIVPFKHGTKIVQRLSSSVSYLSLVKV